MTKYNTKFELSLKDMELIETALQQTRQELACQVIDTDGAEDAALNDDLTGIHDLLGRLHNQKVFYRPSAGAYVGG